MGCCSIFEARLCIMMPNNGECSNKFSAGAGTGFLGTLKMCVRQPAWWCLWHFVQYHAHSCSQANVSFRRTVLFCLCASVGVDRSCSWVMMLLAMLPVSRGCLLLHFVLHALIRCVHYGDVCWGTELCLGPANEIHAGPNYQ